MLVPETSFKRGSSSMNQRFRPALEQHLDLGSIFHSRCNATAERGVFPRLFPRRHPVHTCSGENRSPRPLYCLPSKANYIDSTAVSPFGMFAHHSRRAFAPVEMIGLEDEVCNCSVTCKFCSLLAPAYHRPWLQQCAPAYVCTWRTKNQCRFPPLP